ncbi:MAG TPA: hypothetical protein VGN14_15875 [Candidatus Elarobacter sp.]
MGSVDTMLNKVPQVTLAFWTIKVLCTTVGETFADFLNTKLGLGLNGTSAVMGVILIGMLVVQLTRRRYIPAIYWTVVVLVSIVGTLISDNLVDKLGVTLQTTTTIFAIILAIVFALWWYRERDLSVHHITTTRRELYYWAAILFTFALGTSAGDYLGEALHLGYALSAVVFAAMIALTTIAYYVFRINGVLAFWIAYVLTRPLGASLGDLLSQARQDGGLGFGTTATSAVFLAAIVVLVWREQRRERTIDALAYDSGAA